MKYKRFLEISYTLNHLFYWLLCIVIITSKLKNWLENEWFKNWKITILYFYPKVINCSIGIFEMKKVLRNEKVEPEENWYFVRKNVKWHEFCFQSGVSHHARHLNLIIVQMTLLWDYLSCIMQHYSKLNLYYY